MNDLDLLKEYEPILKFTQGELFFPCPVDEYVRRCSLWQRSTKGEAEQLVGVGELTLDRLASYDEIKPKHTLFLQFVQEPLEGRAYQQWLNRKERERFRAPGRLARVGLTTRIFDSLLDLSLLLRGKVPGGTVAAAETLYREMEAPYAYYGRVIREGGYVILHYLFFYVMNNWRSTFYGVNDHEADWEQVLIYLEDDSPPKPKWVAYAAHDFSGDDLRRHWDDPELTRIGTHPVIFAGAGSHASYFQAGEYLAQVEMAFLKPVKNSIQFLQGFWANTLKQGSSQPDPNQKMEALSLPFIDYARGDGLTIGVDGAGGYDWTPILISDELPWVEHYRGLWGFDAKDPLRGETAPSGPKYNRDGTVRQTWHNPLGWAGLLKVPPSTIAVAVMQDKIADLEDKIAHADAEIKALRVGLRESQLRTEALRQSEHLKPLLKRQEASLKSDEANLNELYAKREALKDTLDAGRKHLKTLQEGTVSDLQGHISHKHIPQSETEVQQSRLAEMWAAISTGLLLSGLGVIVAVDRSNLVPSIVVVVLAFLAIEAFLQKRLHRLFLNITVLLAVATAAILIYEFFWWLLLIGILVVARMIIVGNLRELRGH